MWFAFTVGGTEWDMAMEPQDVDALHRLLSPYVWRAEETLADASPVASVRRWARAQGLKVADRGRLPRDLIDAYNAVHTPKVTDRSGRQRQRVTKMSDIARLSGTSPGGKVVVRTTMWIVDLDGTRREFDPAYFDSARG